MSRVSIPIKKSASVHAATGLLTLDTSWPVTGTVTDSTSSNRTRLGRVDRRLEPLTGVNELQFVDD
ncbi:MAG: hypothetical protein ABI879_00165 [Actinomycetota bacterium]